MTLITATTVSFAGSAANNVRERDINVKQTVFLAADSKGAEQAPFSAVSLLPRAEQAGVSQERADVGQKTSPDWWLVRLTAGLLFAGVAQAVIFVVQARVFSVQATRLKETIITMREIDQGQALKVEKSIGEATRAADAMELVASSLLSQKEFWTRQTRPYLTIKTNGGVYQESDKKLRFQGKVIILNAGSTPAYRVRHRSKAKIAALPFNMTNFDIPSSEDVYDPVIGPHAEIGIAQSLEHYVRDQDVDLIKKAEGQAIIYFGTIEYEDSFGVGYYINFCVVLQWAGDQVFSYFQPIHNDAN